MIRILMYSTCPSALHRVHLLDIITRSATSHGMHQVGGMIKSIIRLNTRNRLPTCRSKVLGGCGNVCEFSHV